MHLGVLHKHILKNNLIFVLLMKKNIRQRQTQTQTQRQRQPQLQQHRPYYADFGWTQG